VSTRMNQQQQQLQSQQYNIPPPTKDTSSKHYKIPGDPIPVTKRPKNNSKRVKAVPTGVGYGNVKKFVNSFLYPFGNDAQNREDGRFSLEMKKVYAEEQRTIEALVKDARGYILSNPEVTKLLGDGIRLGVPFSRSSFTNNNNNSMNGETMTTNSNSRRIRLGIPIITTSSNNDDDNNRVVGGCWLTAKDDGITKLEVIVGGREKIDVRAVDYDEGSERNDAADASVSNKRAYKY